MQPAKTGTIDLTTLDSDSERDHMEQDDHMHDLIDLPSRPERRTPPEDELEDVPLARRLPEQHASAVAAADDGTAVRMYRKSEPRSQASNKTMQTILDAFPAGNHAHAQHYDAGRSEPKPAALHRRPHQGVTSLGQPSAGHSAAKPASGLSHHDISKLWPDEGSWYAS